MKIRATTSVRAISVTQNTTKNKAQWLRIRDARTNKVLHTGTPAYIIKVAATKYNRKIELPTS